MLHDLWHSDAVLHRLYEALGDEVGEGRVELSCVGGSLQCGVRGVMAVSEEVVTWLPIEVSSSPGHVGCVTHLAE